MNPQYSPEQWPQRAADGAQDYQQLAQRLLSSVAAHAQRLHQSESEHLQTLQKGLENLMQSAFDPQRAGQLWNEAMQYAVDAMQRGVLTMDVLRERAENDRAHEAAGTPPVLDYDYEEVLDGRTLKHPVNYVLLRILPPPGVLVHDWKRPYMIIDPRAGHGAGIGGFKPDSQVGVALRGGHPVYFVVFRQHPEPGQTLADVTRAEAQFLREIIRRHPQSPRPVVVGNCQGGWATLLLASTHPQLTGPLVINGAPVATWGGHVGENPMRYKGGLAGGVVPALMASDLGHGEFDGAHLVSNFESLNPSRNYFGKYYDLYKQVDSSDVRKSFLDFERWWGGFHFTNEAEMRWIVEQLFVGNRLSRGEAQLEPGLSVDLRRITAPIIVFASKGDNITPPQQALNWIADTFTDEHEIRIRGQRILYMVHDKVGHLGIFVSSSIARKEHSEVASTLKTIEALPPGLYEMTIDDHQPGTDGNDDAFEVSFRERTLKELLDVVPNDRAQEQDFAAVARMSEIAAHGYEIGLRPLVQSLVTPAAAQMMQALHPMRVGRAVWSEDNPWVRALQPLAEQAREQRQPVGPDNLFKQIEQLLAHNTEHAMDRQRDLREAMDEITFLALYGSPWMHWVGESHKRTRTQKERRELREMPEVQRVLRGVAHGDIAAAVVRMLILLADKSGSVRRDRLERSTHVIHTREPFSRMGDERRATLIQDQSLIVEFEPEQAIETLPLLLADPEQRTRALEMVYFIVGDRSDIDEPTLQVLRRFETVLGMPPTVPLPRPTRRPRKPVALPSAIPSDTAATPATTVKATAAKKARSATTPRKRAPGNGR